MRLMRIVSDRKKDPGRILWRTKEFVKEILIRKKNEQNKTENVV